MSDQFAEPREGDVVYVHALAKFICERCGAWCTRLTKAEVLPDRTIGKAEKPSGEIVCNACTKKERDAENLKYVQDKKRRAWARKMAPMSPIKPKGRA